jgi:hypothetical protein
MGWKDFKPPTKAMRGFCRKGQVKSDMDLLTPTGLKRYTFPFPLEPISSSRLPTLNPWPLSYASVTDITDPFQMSTKIFVAVVLN